MNIKPFQQYTTAASASHVPHALLYFHADDLADDGLSITCRVSGITLNFSGVVLKDSGGMYAAASRTVSSITGTMPMPEGGHLVLVSIGNASSTVGGLNGTDCSFGATGGASTCGFSAGGINYNAGSARNTAPSETLSQVSRPTCQLSYFDLADSDGSPVIRRVAANDYEAISNQTATSTDTNQLTGGSVIIGSTATISGLNGNTDARCKAIIMLEWDNLAVNGAPTAAELVTAAVEMARTQEVYAGWLDYQGATN